MKSKNDRAWRYPIRTSMLFGGGAIFLLLGSCGVVSPNEGEVVGLDEQRLTDIGELSAATTCTDDNQCSTGYCVDGLCCDSKCDNICMACSAAQKGSGADGICGSIQFDTDPDEDCPFGACDGSNDCKNYNSNACLVATECLSNYCVDGVCCGNICMGECQACSAVKKGHGDDGTCANIERHTDPDNECIVGRCNGSGACTWPHQPKFGNGVSCISAAQCDSGFCADGVCCNSWCLGSCEACSAATKQQGSDGTCGPIANDKDPEEECWGGACDGLRMCKQYNGVPCADTDDCLSGYCVEGFCCGNICTQTCYACSEAKKGYGFNGACEPIVAGRDVENECSPGACDGTGVCSESATPQSNGTTCVFAGQCASGNCADGVCCDNSCIGTCVACTAAIKGNGVDGVCGNIGSESDPDLECNGGKCDGAGACRFYNGVPCDSTDDCFSTYCVDGVCCGNICNLECYACTTDKKGEGPDGYCAPILNGLDSENECGQGTCNGAGACTGLSPNGTTCNAGSDCESNHCSDGVCCNTACRGTCKACNLVGSLGICSRSQIGIGDPNSTPPCLGTCNRNGNCVQP